VRVIPPTSSVASPAIMTINIGISDLAVQIGNERAIPSARTPEFILFGQILSAIRRIQYESLTGFSDC